MKEKRVNEIEILTRNIEVKNIKSNTYGAKVCSSGRGGKYFAITIPLEIRELLHLDENDKFRIGMKDGEIVFIKSQSNIGVPIKMKKVLCLPAALSDKLKLKVHDYLIMRIENNRIYAMIERGEGYKR